MWAVTRHSGLDPESKLAAFLDSRFRGNDEEAIFIGMTLRAMPH